MTTAIYARISDDRQDGAGVSRQLADCQGLVERQGWAPAVEYIDNDLSAFSGKVRPRYRDLLGAVESGEVDRIVVYHADRLYRKPRELEDLIGLADQGRVQIASVNSGELDLSNSDGRLVARMLIAVASKESEDKARRVKRAKQQARDEGRGNGGPRAFGWRDSTNPEAAESEAIRQATSDLLAGVSLADVARRWNAANIPQPQTGRPNWTADIVRQVVSNPRHAGLIGHRVEHRGQNGERHYERSTVVGEATWSPIVDRQRWEQLQALLLHRGAAGRIPRRRSLLTGLVTCAACGATMVRTGARGHDASGAIRKVWRCPSSHGCGRVSIDASGLEALLVEATVQRADTDSLAKVVRQQGRQGKQAAELVTELETLAGRMDEAAASFAGGRLPARAFEHATATIQDEQRTLQGRLAKLTATTAIEPYAGRPGTLRTAWPALSVDQRRAIIGAALGRVVVTPGKRGRPTFDRSRIVLG